MITKIEARNYRCLKGVSQNLGRFHVVAGPNGSGKSTFFEVPRVLSAFARGGLGDFWVASAAQTFEELLHQGKGDSFELAIEMAVPENIRHESGQNGKAAKCVRYEVRVGRDIADSKRKDPRILAENLWLLADVEQSNRSERVQLDFNFPSSSRTDFEVVHETAARSSGWKTVAKKTKTGNSYFKSELTSWNLQIRNSPKESALRSLPSDDRFPISNWFRTQLIDVVQHLSLRTDEMRKPSSALKGGGFMLDGSNLPHVVERMQKDTASFYGWIDHMSSVLGVKHVEVIVREEDKSRYLLVHFASGGAVPSWHLSDGTLRMLALSALAYQAENHAVYFIEEPENGIHPQAMEIVFQSLSSIYEGQVLVATHSPVLVGLIEPAQLLCFSKTSTGETDIITGDGHPKLKDWKKGLSLARLYAAGILS